MKEGLASINTVVGALSLVWVANYLSATQLGFPFLYCWLSPVGASLYMAWGTLALYAVISLVIYNALIKSTLKALVWSLIGVLVIELPSAADYMFRLGASCDG